MHLPETHTVLMCMCVPFFQPTQHNKKATRSQEPTKLRAQTGLLRFPSHTVQLHSAVTTAVKTVAAALSVCVCECLYFVLSIG